MLTDNTAREKNNAAIITAISIKMMGLLHECCNLFCILLYPHPISLFLREGGSKNINIRIGF